MAILKKISSSFFKLALLKRESPASPRPPRHSFKLALLSTLFLLYGALAFALTPYTDRPQVTNVPAQTLPEANRPASWERTRQGMMRYFTEMITMFPEEEIYFLARDGEYLYDMAQVLLRDEPQTLARIHLLNVSRGNMRNTNLLHYLEQEGLTAERLANRRAVMVDTGFNGTIPDAIRKALPQDLRPRILAHMMESSNSTIPQSRVFLTDSKGDIAFVEDTLPHYTRSSDGFSEINGRWTPTSSTESPDLARSLTYMADVRAYAETPATRGEFQSIRSDMNLLVQASRSRVSHTPDDLRAAADRLKSRGLNSFLTDLRDAQIRNYSPTEAQPVSYAFWRSLGTGYQPALDNDFGFTLLLTNAQTVLNAALGMSPTSTGYPPLLGLLADRLATEGPDFTRTVAERILHAMPGHFMSIAPSLAAMESTDPSIEIVRQCLQMAQNISRPERVVELVRGATDLDRRRILFEWLSNYVAGNGVTGAARTTLYFNPELMDIALEQVRGTQETGRTAGMRFINGLISRFSEATGDQAALIERVFPVIQRDPMLRRMFLDSFPIAQFANTAPAVKARILQIASEAFLDPATEGGPLSHALGLLRGSSHCISDVNYRALQNPLLRSRVFELVNAARAHQPNLSETEPANLHRFYSAALEFTLGGDTTTVCHGLASRANTPEDLQRLTSFFRDVGGNSQATAFQALAQATPSNGSSNSSSAGNRAVLQSYAIRRVQNSHGNESDAAAFTFLRRFPPGPREARDLLMRGIRSQDLAQRRRIIELIAEIAQKNPNFIASLTGDGSSIRPNEIRTELETIFLRQSDLTSSDLGHIERIIRALGGSNEALFRRLVTEHGSSDPVTRARVLRLLAQFGNTHPVEIRSFALRSLQEPDLSIVMAAQELLGSRTYWDAETLRRVAAASRENPNAEARRSLVASVDTYFDGFRDRINNPNSSTHFLISSFESLDPQLRQRVTAAIRDSECSTPTLRRLFAQAPLELKKALLFNMTSQQLRNNSSREFLLELRSHANPEIRTQANRNLRRQERLQSSNCEGIPYAKLAMGALTAAGVAAAWFDFTSEESWIRGTQRSRPANDGEPPREDSSVEDVRRRLEERYEEARIQSENSRRENNLARENQYRQERSGRNWADHADPENSAPQSDTPSNNWKTFAYASYRQCLTEGNHETQCAQTLQRVLAADRESIARYTQHSMDYRSQGAQDSRDWRYQSTRIQCDQYGRCLPGMTPRPPEPLNPHPSMGPRRPASGRQPPRPRSSPR